MTYTITVFIQKKYKTASISAGRQPGKTTIDMGRRTGHNQPLWRSHSKGTAPKRTFPGGKPKKRFIQKIRFWIFLKDLHKSPKDRESIYRSKFSKGNTDRRGASPSGTRGKFVMILFVFTLPAATSCQECQRFSEEQGGIGALSKAESGTITPHGCPCWAGSVQSQGVGTRAPPQNLLNSPPRPRSPERRKGASVLNLWVHRRVFPGS